MATKEKIEELASDMANLLLSRVDSFIQNGNEITGWELTNALIAASIVVVVNKCDKTAEEAQTALSKAAEWIQITSIK